MPIATNRGLRPAKVSALAAALALGALLAPSIARADDDEGFDKGGDDQIAADKQAREEKEKGDKEEKPADEKPKARDPRFDPYEDPTKAYHFLGIRYRDAIVPKFMLNWFADGGRNVNVPMIGVEFTRRKDHLQIDLALSYADYSMDPFLFKGKNDPDTAYEIVSSSLKQMLFTVDLMYDIPIDQGGMFSVLVGGGVGIGGVFGNLYRNQATPAGGVTKPNPDDVTDWIKCPAASKGTTAYCDAANNHYGDYSEPSWANGGSKPLIFPWIALPQVAFRFKPIKQLQTKVDTGFSTSGFFFSIGAGYGF